MRERKTKSFLHVGCGPITAQQVKGFGAGDWEEIRLDIDPGVSPDIQGSITDMTLVGSSSVDAIYSSHNLEHLYPHQVPVALMEFYRVLAPDGFAVITCPDLVSVCMEVVAGRLLDPLYQSSAGPISAIDILYGHRGFIAAGNEFMAHKCGFDYSVLRDLVLQAGFKLVLGGTRAQAYDLWLLAFKERVPEDTANKIADNFLP